MAGPFANIAQGTNSVIATKTSLALTDYTVTEAGFGFDLGAEKFIDIKARSAGLAPNAVVLVTTVRALKYHGGQPIKELAIPNIDALKKGVVNLQKHIENVSLFELSPIIAINHFVSDSQQELDYIKDYCSSIHVPCSIVDVWSDGGKGAEELARMVVKIADNNNKLHPLYPLTDSVEKKIETIATKIYGANAVNYSVKAHSDLKKIANLGLEDLAICVAKT